MVKLIFLVVDILLCTVLAIGFFLWAGSIYLYNHFLRLLRERRKAKERKILFFVSSNYAAIKERGMVWGLKQRNEEGYFDFVYTIHPFVSPTQIINISDKNILIEYGTERYDRLKSLGLRYTRAMLTLWGFLSFVINRITREKINIIRGNGPYVTGLLALICSKLTNIPSCVSIHADFDLAERISPELAPVILGSPKLAKRLRRFVLSHARMVMPIREYLGKVAIKNGAKPERIRIIPHGIETKNFLRNPDPNLKREFGVEGKKLVVFVGRLSKENYVEDIIKSAVKVIKRFPDAVFLLAGDGTERESLSKLITDLNLKENVKLLGFQSHDKVVDLKLNADVNLCLMGGFSLIEAAVSGKPTIAYDVEWHYELIKNGETGFLIKEGDIDAVTDAIIKLLNNPDLGKRLGENARKLAMERHSLEASSKIKIKHYEELLQMSKR